MLLLFEYQEGIQCCKVPTRRHSRADDFPRSLKAESTWASWSCHLPALIDEVTEHGLHLLFRRLLWDLDQFPHFFYAFFLKTDHRAVGPVVEIPDHHIPETTVACLGRCGLYEAGGAPSLFWAEPGITAAFPLWAPLSVGPDEPYCITQSHWVPDPFLPNQAAFCVSQLVENLISWEIFPNFKLYT